VTRFCHWAAEAIEITISPRLLAIANDVIGQTTPEAVGPWSVTIADAARVMAIASNQITNDLMKLDGSTD